MCRLNHQYLWLLINIDVLTLGDALKDRDVPIDHVYASPSLRCVETATSILQGMNTINGITRVWNTRNDTVVNFYLINNVVFLWII